MRPCSSIDNHSRLRLNLAIIRPGDKPMYVCICNGISDRAIREAAEAGCDTVAEMTMRTGAVACCGSCRDLVAEIIQDVQAGKALELPVLAHAA